MNTNLFWIIAFLIVFGGFILIRYLFPVKEDPDTVDDISGNEIEENQEDIPSDLVNVPGHLFLYYSPTTRYVYSVSFTGNAKIFDVYISKNNRLCKYLGSKIVEVEDDKVVAIVYNDSLPN